MLPALLALAVSLSFADEPANKEEEEEVVDLDAEEGHLPEGTVATVMGRSEAAVMDCAKRFGTRATHGRIEFSWQIELDGTVGRLKMVESGLKNPLLEECLTAVVKKAQFPKPRGGVVPAKHAFTF
jgi:hypothetical protein